MFIDLCAQYWARIYNYDIYDIKFKKKIIYTVLKDIEYKD